MGVPALADLTDDQAEQAVDRFCEANFARISNKSGFLMVRRPHTLLTRLLTDAGRLQFWCLVGCAGLCRHALLPSVQAPCVVLCGGVV